MLQILIGNIASGKSTYSQHMSRNGWLVVNDDSIVTMLHSGNYDLYDDRFRSLYKSIVVHTLDYALGNGLDIILDATNVTRESRMRWKAIADIHKQPTTYVVFPQQSPEIHAERRFRHDSRGVSAERWLQVANKMADEYRAPTLDEGADIIYVDNSELARSISRL